MFQVRILIFVFILIFSLKMSHPSLFVSAMKLSNCQYTVQERIKGCKTGAAQSENIVYISCAYAVVIEKGHVNVFSFCC